MAIKPEADDMKDVKDIKSIKTQEEDDQDGLAALEALDKEASEFNKVIDSRSLVGRRTTTYFPTGCRNRPNSQSIQA